METITKNTLTRRKAECILALVGMSRGVSYLLMKVGMESIPPYMLIALRFGIAFLVVGVLFVGKLKETDSTVLKHSAVLGLLLFAVFAFLMHGMKTTSTSNAGFLISTMVVMVPVLHSLWTRTLPSRVIVTGTLITTAGIALLSLQESLALHSGDALCLCGAVAYAIHVLYTDYATKECDGLLVGIWQLGFAALFGLVFSFLFEVPVLPQSPAQWGAVLGLALICSAFSFVMQPVAQKHTSPECTSLLLTLEPVFSAILAFLVLHEVLNFQGYLGAALVLAGVLYESLTPESSSTPKPPTDHLRKSDSPSPAI